MDCSSKSDSDGAENYIVEIPGEYEVNEKGLGWQLFSNMKEHYNDVAQYIVDTDETETYGEILTSSIRVAMQLQRRGFTSNDIVMQCCHIHKYSCIPLLACFFLGIPIASLHPTLSVLDTVHMLTEVTPRVLFIDEVSYKLIRTSMDEAGIDAEIIIYGTKEHCTPFADLLVSLPNETEFQPFQVNSLEDTALIVYSSGTTNLPKGIMLNNYSLLSQSIYSAHTGFVGMKCLTYTAYYWISAVLFLIAGTMNGAARIISQFSPGTFWKTLSKYQVTDLFLAPYQALIIIKDGRPKDADTNSLNTLAIGGGPMSEKHIIQMRELLPGTLVTLVYGCSEVAGLLTAFHKDELELIQLKPKSVGKPIPGISYKVVDVDSGKICGPNEHGELRVKTRYAMNGFYKKDTSEAFDCEGWLKTGDVVYYDEDKYFYVVDRIKEVFKYKGVQISPTMIEEILENHPSVARSIVIGIPNDEDGDHPMAIVILNKEYKGQITEKEIEAFVADKVPDRMRLRGGVLFLDKLPLTPSGKIRRKEIRDIILEQQKT